VPTFRHGKKSVFKAGSAGTPTTPVDISNVLNEAALNRGVGMADTTTFGADDESSIPGLRNGRIPIAGLFDATTDAQLSALLGLDGGVTFEYGPEGSASGRIRYTGTCHLVSYNVSGSVGDRVAASGEFQVSGAVTRNTWP
jgi:hypothetical protein